MSAVLCQTPQSLALASGACLNCRFGGRLRHKAFLGLRWSVTDLEL